MRNEWCLIWKCTIEERILFTLISNPLVFILSELIKDTDFERSFISLEATNLIEFTLQFWGYGICQGMVYYST